MARLLIVPWAPHDHAYGIHGVIRRYEGAEVTLMSGGRWSLTMNGWHRNVFYFHGLVDDAGKPRA